MEAGLEPRLDAQSPGPFYLFAIDSDKGGIPAGCEVKEGLSEEVILQTVLEVWHWGVA